MLDAGGDAEAFEDPLGNRDPALICAPRGLVLTFIEAPLDQIGQRRQGFRRWLPLARSLMSVPIPPSIIKPMIEMPETLVSPLMTRICGDRSCRPILRTGGGAGVQAALVADAGDAGERPVDRHGPTARGEEAARRR